MKKVKWLVVKLKNRRVRIRRTKSGIMHLRFVKLDDSGERIIESDLLVSPDVMDALTSLWVQHRHDLHPNPNEKNIKKFS